MKTGVGYVVMWMLDLDFTKYESGRWSIIATDSGIAHTYTSHSLEHEGEQSSGDKEC